MHLFRKTCLTSALIAAVALTAQAHAQAAQSQIAEASSSSLIASGPTFSSSIAALAPADDAAQDSVQQQAPAVLNGQQTVQERIRARRAARRAAAIREVYTHRYDVEVGSGYMRFSPGASQRATEYAWNLEFTRYSNERFGITGDVRGLYGTGYVGPTFNSTAGVYKPAISQYLFEAGPTYRLYMQPKYSVSARVLVGGDKGNFSGDLGAYPPSYFGYHNDGWTFSVNPAVVVEYNVSPKLGIRVSPEYDLTHFTGQIYNAGSAGSPQNPAVPASTVNGPSWENSLGFTAGVVYRWGKY